MFDATPGLSFDFSELEKAFSDKTRAIILNTPHNPTGKVFSKEEMAQIANFAKSGVCSRSRTRSMSTFCMTVLSIMRLLLFGNGRPHRDHQQSFENLQCDRMESGLGNGSRRADTGDTQSARLSHSSAPAPLQRAGVTAINMQQRYYDELASEYSKRREYMLETLDMVGIKYFKPQGAYYVFCDISSFGFENESGVYQTPLQRYWRSCCSWWKLLWPIRVSNRYVRFCFSRRMETLQAARERLFETEKVTYSLQRRIQSHLSACCVC